MSPSPPPSPRRSRRAGWWALFFGLGLFSLLLALGLVSAQHRRQWRGLGPPLPDPVAEADVPSLCVNVYLQQYRSRAEIDWELDLVVEGGFGWVRQTFPWADIEPSPGEYGWSPWDQRVDAVVDRGLDLIAVIDRAPGWAVGDRETGWDATPPTDPADLAAFAGALAKRYGDRIDYYQIWDEPNLSSHWGGRDVDPAAYAAMLQAASQAIRDADPEARILLAGLAPTEETGPRNLSEIRYLRALYQAGAGPHFDVAAGKPYGFDTGPDDRRLDESILNFSRLILLREEMIAQGDADKALWASHWGWNALPPDWAGQPSIWGQVDEGTQAAFTLAALERARREWPWVGAMCLESLRPAATYDDPRWGFALTYPNGLTRPVYEAVKSFEPASSTNYPGYYPAATGVADYQGDWRLSELGADPSQQAGDRVLIPFQGTEFGLRVRRGGYRAHFYVSVDGQPANQLPQDEHGAYLVLTSPDEQPQVTTIPAARGLAEGPHQALVEAERGWEQWPLVGWSVGWRPVEDEAAYRRWQVVLGGLALVCLVGLVWAARRVEWRWLALVGRRLSAAAQTLIAVGVTGVFWASAWLTWGQERAAGGVGLVATVAAATVFGLSPILLLSLLSLVVLAVLFVLRLDLGLALVAFAAPFYLQSRPMYDRAFSVVEVAIALCLLSWLVHLLRRNRTKSGFVRLTTGSARALDWAVLLFVAACFISPLVADLPGVAWRELRVVVIEPALFYLLLRTTRLDRGATWRIVDAFVLGAIGVALIGLYQYVFTADIITAEAGLRRLKSVYGSPNNVGLYLGRALPVLLAVALWGRSRWRRWSYGAGAGAVGLAILLSFSKGALFFGLPASLLALGLLAGGRWLWAALVALGAGGLAAIPLLRTSRFASALDLSSGTSFFRLNLWRSTVDMIRDHPLFGVGLDNFLYVYRGRYIRPVAWQEPDLSHPHNVLLDYWSRLGIIGVAAGLWLQAAFWRLIWPLRKLADPDDRALAWGLMASMVDFLAHGLVDNSYFLVDLAFVFFLTLGLTVRLAQVRHDVSNGRLG